MKSATKIGYEIAEVGDSINLQNINSETRRGRVGKGVAQTILTANEQCVVEPMIEVWDGYNQNIRQDNSTVGTLTRNCGADLKRNGQGIIEYYAYDEQNGYVREDGTVGTLTTDGNSPKHNNRVVELAEPTYRIRKLTERECGRLMGLRDEEIALIAKNQSMSSMYHLFGDSIVVDVLEAIFGEMI